MGNLNHGKLHWKNPGIYLFPILPNIMGKSVCIQKDIKVGIIMHMSQWTFRESLEKGG